MRSFLSISLVTLLLLNLFGFYFIFMIRQDDIRKEMSELVKQERSQNVQFISFSKYDFDKIVWEQQGKEIRFKGRLYDVTGIEISPNEIKLYVEEDARETDLISDFVSVISSQTEKDQTNSPAKLLLEHFLKEFTVGQTSYIYDPVVSFILFINKDFHFTSFISDQQFPPPDWHLS